MPACNKTNNVSTSNSTNNVYSKEIDDRGGTVGESGGLSVYIPGGAVPEPVTISIRQADVGEYPTPPANLAGNVFAIEPHGLELSAKATVHLPFPDGSQPGFLAPIHAELNGAWAPLNGGLESGARTATFQTYTFSFFALEDVMSSYPGSGGAPAKPVEAGGGPGYGGTATAGAGTPGTGGSAPVGNTNYCQPVAAPTGSTDVQGAIKFVGGAGAFTAKDGLAAKMVMGERTFLLLTFTESGQACGSVLAAGWPISPKPVAGGTPGHSIGVALDIFTPDTPGEIPQQTTYPRAGQPEMIDALAFELDDQCREMSAPMPPDATVTIDTLTTNRVTGSISLLDDGSGFSLSGMFDLPICPLPEAPEGRCCVEP